MFSRLYLGTNNPAEILSEVDLKHMSQLDERTKRHFLATRALSLGRHGVSLVAEACGVNRDTIYRASGNSRLVSSCPRDASGKLEAATSAC